MRDNMLINLFYRGSNCFAADTSLDYLTKYSKVLSPSLPFHHRDLTLFFIVLLHRERHGEILACSDKYGGRDQPDGRI